MWIITILGLSPLELLTLRSPALMETSLNFSSFFSLPSWDLVQSTTPSQKQWAAVRMWSLVTSAPPHAPSFTTIFTIHG